nr:hypothetical protein [Tanacetum cinerariifolium]
EVGSSSRARKASTSSRRKSRSPKGVRVEEEDSIAVLDGNWIMKYEPMAWQTDYCIMKEGMSILRGWKSVPGMNSGEREMERRYYSAFT